MYEKNEDTFCWNFRPWNDETLYFVEDSKDDALDILVIVFDIDIY